MSEQTRQEAGEAGKHLKSAEQHLEQAHRHAQQSGDRKLAEQVQKITKETRTTREDVERKLGNKDQ